jgi:hypothetical protein
MALKRRSVYQADRRFFSGRFGWMREKIRTCEKKPPDIPAVSSGWQLLPVFRILSDYLALAALYPL